MNRSPRLLASLLVFVAGDRRARRGSLLRPPKASPPSCATRRSRGESVAWDFVSELTTRIGPRPAGSAAERAAAEWSAKKLKALGFENVRIEPFPMTAWVRGTEQRADHRALAAAGRRGRARRVAADAGRRHRRRPRAVRDARRPEGRRARLAHGQDRDDHAPDAAHAGWLGLRRIFALTARWPDSKPRIAAPSASCSARSRRVASASRTPAPRDTTARAFRFRPSRCRNPTRIRSSRLTQLGEKVRLRLTSTASLRSERHLAERGGGHSRQRAPERRHRARRAPRQLGPGHRRDRRCRGLAIITGAARLIGQAPRKPKRTVRVVFFGSEEVSQPGSDPARRRVLSERAHRARSPRTCSPAKAISARIACTR